jgi:HK97 family phage major capsid protein
VITYLRKLTDERDSLTQAAQDLSDKAASEDRDLSDTEQQSMRGWQTRCAEIDTQLTEYNAQAESQRAYARLREQLQTADADAGNGRELQRRAPARVEQRGASWGDAFVTSDAFTNYPGAGTSPRVELPFALETRAEISLGDLGTAVPPFTFAPTQPGVFSPLLDVVGKVVTSSGSVQWVKWTPAKQAGPDVTAEGALKPEAVMVPSVVPGSLETYAHWKGITRQALEDLPQIRSVVENRLRQGLVTALEGAVADAINAATIPPVTGSAAASDTLLGVIRGGIATVQAAGYQPNAVLLNPADFADMDVAIMGGTLNGPTVSGSYWGLRPIASPDVPAGTAYVGDFQSAVELFTRGNADVYLTDSHADYFIRNILLLLAEVRALATVPVPEAAAECTVGV